MSPTMIDSPASQSRPVLHLGPLMVNPYLRRVEVDGELVDLTRREYDLLIVLAGEPRRVFTREELCQSVLGFSQMRGRAIDSHASRLRRKIGNQFVVNVWGIGYRLTSDLIPSYR